MTAQTKATHQCIVVQGVLVEQEALHVSPFSTNPPLEPVLTSADSCGTLYNNTQSVLLQVGGGRHSHDSKVTGVFI